MNITEYTMKVEFFNENGCPPDPKTWKHMEGGFYDSFISILESIKVPDTKVKLLDISNLDRGVKNWQQFGNLLRQKFPNLKGLVFEMNYYYNSEEDDPWKTAETFFVQMELDHLDIIWAQQFEGNVTNAESTDAYTVDFHIGDNYCDDPDDFDSIREEISNEARESGSNYNIYIEPPTPPPQCCVCEKESEEDYCQECIDDIESLGYNIITERCGHKVVACCQAGTRWEKDCVESPENCVLCNRDVHPSEYYDALRENDDYHVALQTLLGIDPNDDSDNEYDYVYCRVCI